jgi:pSer/pThr/pTyr-binding forkhead associated (FHA) protein
LVLDDGSLTGVFLNGNRTESGGLTDGDEIRVGSHRLLYGVFDWQPQQGA